MLTPASAFLKIELANLSKKRTKISSLLKNRKDDSCLLLRGQMTGSVPGFFGGLSGLRPYTATSLGMRIRL